MKLIALLMALVGVSPVLAATELHPDVTAFIAERDGCDHFRGEPRDPGDEPLVKERREFIFKNIMELCTGSDKRLADLRRKFKNNPAIIEKLRDYEDKIEISK